MRAINQTSSLTESLEKPLSAIDINLASKVIEELKSQLHEKSLALEQSLEDQHFLRKQLTQCATILQATCSKLNFADSELADRLQQINQYIECLEQENDALKSANAAWADRAINLQFDVLTAQIEMNKNNGS